MIGKKNLVLVSLFTLLNCLIINFSVNLLNYKLPDSSSYLNFSAKYKSLYPFLINFIDYLNLNLIYIQILLLSFSIVYLCYSVLKKNSFYISFILYLSIIANFFYTSFSKTILTESLFFSLINVGICLFILN